MARIRTVKPEFWTSEQIVECSTNARLLFIGMWNFCDDAGRHPASAKRLKMEVFPADAFSIDEIVGWVDELLGAGLLGLYEAQGRSYWYVTGWGSHQKIDRPTVKHPDPFDEDSTITRRTIAEASPPEGKGMESKGMESKEEISSSADADGPSPSSEDVAFDEFWKPTANKVAKQAAKKAWLKAVKLIHAIQLGTSIADARAWLLERWTLYNASPKARGQFSPHPATWLNEGRYDDDEAAWQDGGNKGGSQGFQGVDPAQTKGASP